METMADLDSKNKQEALEIRTRKIQELSQQVALIEASVIARYHVCKTVYI